LRALLQFSLQLVVRPLGVLDLLLVLGLAEAEGVGGLLLDTLFLLVEAALYLDLQFCPSLFQCLFLLAQLEFLRPVLGEFLSLCFQLLTEFCRLTIGLGARRPPASSTGYLVRLLPQRHARRAESGHYLLKRNSLIALLIDGFPRTSKAE